MSNNPTKSQSPVVAINAALKKLGRTERFVRGRGYYYVIGTHVSSGLYHCWLDDNANDHHIAREHVEEVLTNADGKPFKFPT